MRVRAAPCREEGQSERPRETRVLAPLDLQPRNLFAQLPVIKGDKGVSWRVRTSKFPLLLEDAKADPDLHFFNKAVTI